MNNTTGPIVIVVAPDKSLPLKGFGTKDFLGRMPNIGILYLAAALEAQGYETITLDRQHDSIAALQLASEINALKPSLVGFTLYDVTLEPTRQTLTFLRLAYKGPIVIGGYTPTFHAADILREWAEVDYVVVREGEKAMVALVEHLSGKRPIEQVPNLVYREGDKVCSNPEHQLVDVLKLPWPRRNWSEQADVTPIVTRRGCMSRCSFCSMVPFYDLKLGPIVRTRSPSDVADEIYSCINHGHTEFMFYDDDFGLSSKEDRLWCEQFMKEVRRRHLDFHWGVELRVTDVMRGSSLLHELCDIGLTHISMGVESMLPRQLELYNKGYKQKDIFKAIEMARDLPIDFQTNIIFWDPWTTMEEAVEHVDLLDQIGIQDQLGSANFPFYAGVLVARRGTQLHTLLTEANLLQLRQGSFCEYTYDFVDPNVVAFHKGAHLDFMRRVRSVDRPSALWLFVPRIEHSGNKELGNSFRVYAQAVAHAEFDYYKALLTAACRLKNSTEFKHVARELHEEFGPQVDACASLLPEINISEILIEG